MADHVLLRTLTRKSTWNIEGQWRDWKVQDLIEQHPGVIVWAYFHRSGITFTEDILDELYINTRIDKPGKDPDAYEKRKWCIARSMADNGNPGYLRRLMAERRREKKLAMELLKEEDKLFCKKGRLAWINQGHGGHWT